MPDFDPQNTKPEGPCNRIRNSRGWEAIADIIERTDDTGREHAIIIIEQDGEFHWGHPIKGVEEAILPADKTEAVHQMFQKQAEIGGNIHDQKLHFIHTHPNGFAGMSLGDLVSIPFDIDNQVQQIDSHLVATEIDLSKVYLGGLYKDIDVTDDDLDTMKTAASTVSSLVDQSDITYDQGKRRLFNEYDRYFDECSIVGMI